MAPSRRKGSARAAAAAALQQWKIGDLVLAKMKGFPAWPAMISDPEKWGFSSDRKKILVYFYGTKQIAFCNYADIEAFTEEKKKSLLVKRQGKGADFVRAVEEISDVYETLKKQSVARSNFNDGGNVGDASSKEHLEDARVDCFGNTVGPILSSCLKHQLEGTSVTELGDIGIMDDSPVDLLDYGNQKRNAVVDSVKNISILDQLRKTPLSTVPTTRKRARDALLPTSVTKSAPSLRRSRSSLVNKASKSKKSSMQVDVKLDISCPASDILLKKRTPKEQAIRVHLVKCSADTSSIAKGVSLDDNVTIKSECASLDDRYAQEYSGKFECSNNEAGTKSFLDEDARLVIKDEIPSTLVSKAKRKHHRKQLINGRSWGGVDKGIDVQTECANLSDSSISRNGITVTFSNADGDGHLPLVKRARVRMGKTPSKEENLNETTESQVKLDNLVSSNEHCESTKFSTSVNDCPLKTDTPKRPSPGANNVSRSSTNGSVDDITGRDLLSSKVSKYHLMLDVEAALPPSKRLHRALEAMSANAAEAAIDCPQAPNETETGSSYWLGSAENVHPVSESVKSPIKPLHMQIFDRHALDKTACGLSSSLTSQNPADCCLTSSDVKLDETDSETVMNSLQKFSQEITTERSCYHGSFTSNASDPSNSFSVELVDNCCSECKLNPSLSPVMEGNKRFQPDREFSYSVCETVAMDFPKPTEACSSQQLSGLSPSGVPSTSLSTSNTVCSASEIDGTAPCSDALNIDASATCMNVIPSVSSATTSTSCINGACAASLSTNFSSTINDNSMVTVSSSSHIEQNYRVRDMQNVGVEVKQNLKIRNILSKLAPIKDLIAAAQAKRVLSRCTSSCDSVIDGKIAYDAVVSPKLINKEDPSVRSSPSNSMFYHRTASDDGTCYLQNGNKTPLDGSSRKGLSKCVIRSEANAARRCFESLLSTLSRTKESIGRATRLAIDCAKYGIACEVIDILLHYLEKESSLHRRVDLFFLVDSITQCSRCQKSGPGDVYPSLVQAVLPRLLSAAAPPGNAASENRRQCLKVLRLWLERKTLPEFTVRHHIRELEYGSEASLSISYSRRPPRTERPLNDPVREMEGMLVDEYGSNASFQLPRFLNTRILEDDEGSSSDERSFEAVTPDMNSEIDYEKGSTPISANKHRLVLEDVDGELEMEDVAPPCGQELSHVKGDLMVRNCNSNCEQNSLLSLAPPLPQERPPSPPPLPSSPPPLPLPCATAIGQAPRTLAGLTAADNTDFNLSGASYTAQNQFMQPVSQQTRSLSSLSEPGSYSQGYVSHPQQMPHLVPSCTSSGSYGILGGSQPAIPVGNNSISIVNVPSTSTVYHLQPPPPVVSNQFSYIQAQSQHKAPGNQSSYSDRFHHSHDIQRANFFGEGDSRGAVQVDVSDKSAFYTPVRAGHVGLAPEKAEAPHASAYYSPRMDQSSAASQDWSYPSRTSSYPLSTSRSPLEKPVSGVSGAPSYWRSR